MRLELKNRLVAKLLIVAALFLGVGLTGCKSGPEEADEQASATETGAQDERAVEFDALEHLERRAEWLPPNTELVAVADASYLWAFFGELVPSQDGDDAGERAEDLKARLSSVFSDRVRLDLTQVDSAVLAASENRVALLFDGAFERPEGATRLEMNGFEVLRLTRPFEGAFQSEFLQLMAGQIDLFMVMLDEPRGVAIFVDELSVQQATARMARGEASLAGSERLATFQALFDLTDKARLIVAGAGAKADEEPDPAEMQNGMQDGMQDEMQNRMQSGVESAEEAILAFGPSVQASFRGSAPSLDQIEDEVQNNLARLQTQLRDMDRVAPGETLLEASAGAIVAFLGESYIDALEVTRQKDVLSYELPLPDSRSSAAVAAVVGLGLADWLERGMQFGPPQNEL